MNRKQLEDSAWAKTPKDERRSQKERYDWKTQKTIVERLKGNAREVRVFDPSGSTEGTLSPWMPLWSLYSDELQQRSKEEREPKLRPPYSRGRSDYTGDVESSPVARRHSTVKSKPSKKSPAQLQREIDEVLSQPATSSSVRLPPGAPAAWAHRHLSKANTPSELEEVWRVMRKPWTGMGEYYASRTGIALSEIDSVYQQHRARVGEGRAHSSIRQDTPRLKVGDVVQLRWEPGTGGTIRRFEADDAWVATSRGDRKVPADALVRVRKEHEARVRRAVGTQRGHSTIKASTAFDEARAESALIEKEVDAASDALRAFPRGSMGLTPDAVRATPEYRAANARYQKAFARQRAFNTTFTKKFAKELRAERDKRYGR